MSAARRDRWRWIETGVVLAIHDRQLAEHGGADGIRDRSAVDGDKRTAWVAGRVFLAVWLRSRLRD